MRRRSLLTAGSSALSALALSGCVGLGAFGDPAVAEAPTARLSMESVSDAGIARRVLPTVTAESAGDRPTPAAELVAEMEEEGSATTEATRQPLRVGQPVLFEDTVYRFASETVEETPATRFSVRLDIVNGDEPDGRRVRFAELPAADRRAFERAGFADGISGVITGILYTDQEVERSVLVPETDVVVIEWPETEAEWRVDGAATMTLYTYRYTIEETRPAAELGRAVRDRFAWTLSGLSEPERSVVAAATGEDSYRVGPDETVPSEFASLARRFETHESVPQPLYQPEPTGTPTSTPECPDGGCPTENSRPFWADVTGSYLVDYESRTYWVSLAVRRTALGSPTA